jgi:membrane-associated phospholipid phosphatase
MAPAMSDPDEPSPRPTSAPSALTRHDLVSVGALVAVLVIAVGVLGAIVRQDGPPAIDLTVPSAVMAWYPAAATDLFDTLGTLPVFAALMALGLLICLVRGQVGLALAFGLGLCGEIPSTLVKLIVDRPRPPASTEIEAFITAASYPSGHTVRAVLIAGLIVAAVGWHGRRGLMRFLASIVGIAFVALVGLARIASGQHWPTDVLGGLLLGVAWLAVCITAGKWLEGRRASRPANASG